MSWSRAAVACVITLALGGCAGSAQDQAVDRLVVARDGVHERALAARAADPAAPAGQLFTSVDARVQTGGGLSYEQANLVLCLEVTTTFGAPDGAVGERGTVRTGPVPCPASVLDERADSPLDDVLDDPDAAAELEPVEDDVPRP